MTRIRVLKPFSHAGKRYRQGDTLEMPDRFARVMNKIGKTEPVPETPPPAPSSRSYRRRDMVAESPKAEPEPAPPAPSEPPLDLPALPSSDDK